MIFRLSCRTLNKTFVKHAVGGNSLPYRAVPYGLATDKLD